MLALFRQSGNYMSQAREQIYKAIEDNELDKVLFSDPFSETTRRSKRNLLIASFSSILIATLDLEINSFLGLKATNSLGSEVTQGLAFFIVVYFLLSFAFQAYIDYVAWKFQREKQLTKPYLELVSFIEMQVSVTKEQIDKTKNRVNDLSGESSMQGQVNDAGVFSNVQRGLESIEANLSSSMEEINPLLITWSENIEKMKELSTRLRVRFCSLWTLDILFPLIISLSAMYQSYGCIAAVLVKFES
jgi:hypothetical protein